MAMNPDSAFPSALEAFAHCCTEDQLRHFLETLPPGGRERLISHGHLALLRAMESNKESAGVVGALLEQPEIQVNLPHIGQDGNTILHFAVLLQDEEVVRLILGRGDLDPNVGNLRGESPVHVAVAKGPSCSNILKLLVSDPRVSIAARTSDKRTVLHIACKGDIWDSASKDIVRNVLLASVKSIPQFLKNVDEFGRTALHYAAESGLDVIVGEILDALQPLQNSDVSNDHVALARDNTGCLAVHLAAQKGHLKVVQHLLQLDLGDCKDQDGLTVAHHAIRCGRKDVVQECLKYTKPYESVRELYLNLLTVTTHQSVADCLLDTLYKSQVKDKNQYPSLLHWAVQEYPDGHLEIARFIPHILKWHPVDYVNESLDDATKRTPLHTATISENVDAVRALCSEKDLNVNQRDVHDKTALDYALENGNEHIKRILMKRTDVKEHLARLHKNRETYAMASHAILVVSALIATLTYSRCVTAQQVAKTEKELADLAPSLAPGSSATEDLADYIILYATMPTRVAFLLSLTSTILAAFAALPFSYVLCFVQTVDDNYVRRSLHRTRVLIVLASAFLMLSLGAVMTAFICSQYISPFLSYRCAFACKIVMIVFVCLAAVFLGMNAVMSIFWRKGLMSRKSKGPYSRLVAFKYPPGNLIAV